DGCWRRGWQPANLVHAVGHLLSARHGRICRDAIGLQSRTYATSPGADPAWLQQLEAIGADSPVGADGLLGRWADVTDDNLGATVNAAAAVLGLLVTLPAIPRLSDPPSSWGRSPARSAAARCDPKMAERVRALLAKAESTPYPEE